MNPKFFQRGTSKFGIMSGISQSVALLGVALAVSSASLSSYGQSAHSIPAAALVRTTVAVCGHYSQRTSSSG